MYKFLSFQRVLVASLAPKRRLLDLTGAALLRPSPEADPAAGGSSLDPARFELDSDPEGLDICLANVADWPHVIQVPLSLSLSLSLVIMKLISIRSTDILYNNSDVIAQLGI